MQCPRLSLLPLPGMPIRDPCTVYPRTFEGSFGHSQNPMMTRRMHS